MVEGQRRELYNVRDPEGWPVYMLVHEWAHWTTFLCLGLWPVAYIMLRKITWKIIRVN